MILTRGTKLLLKGLTPHAVRTRLTPWLFVLPGILLTFVLRYYTMGHSLWISLHNYDVANPPGKFTGLENYIFMLGSPDFWNAAKNTAVFALMSLALTFFVPLLQAVCLSEIRRGRGVFSSLYLIPAVFPLSVTVIIWKWIFNPSFGLANAFLGMFGMPPQAWYSDPNLTIFCIVFPGIIGGGFGVLLYLAAILGISRDISDAATVDGCNGLQRLIYITLPNIRFLIMIQLIIAVIGVLQILDAPFQFTGGGPNQASTSLAFLSYTMFNERMNFGRSSATAFMLMIVIAVISYIQMRVDKAEKE